MYALTNKSKYDINKLWISIFENRVGKYDDNGVGTITVTQYDKDGNVVAKESFADFREPVN